MTKYRLIAPLLIMGGVLTLCFALHFDLIIVAVRGFSETIVIVLQTFMLRRLERPVWNLLFLFGVVALVGTDRMGRFHRRCLDPIHHIEAWNHWPRWLRVVLFSGVGICITFALWYASYHVAAILSLGIVLEKIGYWLGDRIFDRFTIPIKIRLHYFVHQDRVVWRLLRWPRHIRAVILSGLKIWHERREQRRQQGIDSKK